MKSIKLLITTFMITIMSCGDHEYNNILPVSTIKGKSGLSYAESLEKWNDMKSANGNSYIYQTSFDSWAGFGSTTELRIEVGILISRKYEAYNINSNDGSKEITNAYTETSTDLGSHENGAPLLTIDDLYSSCLSEYIIVDTNTNSIYFETETNGLMTTCGYVPNGCTDDCFYGVRIKAFDWIN